MTPEQHTFKIWWKLMKFLNRNFLAIENNTNLLVWINGDRADEEFTLDVVILFYICLSPK